MLRGKCWGLICAHARGLQGSPVGEHLEEEQVSLLERCEVPRAILAEKIAEARASVAEKKKKINDLHPGEFIPPTLIYTYR